MGASILLWRLACILGLLIAGATAQTDSGRLASIDPKGCVLTLTKGRPNTVYRFRDTVEVFINGERAHVDQLVPGLKVLLELHEPGVATTIRATGLLAT